MTFTEVMKLYNEMCNENCKTLHNDTCKNCPMCQSDIENCWKFLKLYPEKAEKILKKWKESKTEYIVDTKRITDTTNITVGWDSDSGRDFYFADIVYDNDELRCPVSCDVDNIIETEDFEVAKMLAEKVSKKYKIPVNIV